MDHTFVDFAEIFAEIICIICSIRIWTWCLMCGNSSWRTARTDLDLRYCNRYVLQFFLPNWVVPICYKDIDHNPSLLYEGYGSSCRSRFHVRRAIVHLGKNDSRLMSSSTPPTHPHIFGIFQYVLACLLLATTTERTFPVCTSRT